MKRSNDARTTGWFRPWKEWLGTTIMLWPLFVLLVIIAIMKILQVAGCIKLMYETG